MQRRSLPSRRGERGSVLLIVVIAAVALIGIAGLALDASRLGYMKARLQTVADAMALSAAKRLDETGTTAAACEAAKQTLSANLPSFHELADALPANVSCTDFLLQYSSSIAPFVAGTSPARYVRIRLDEVKTGASLAKILGFFDLEVAASAVAGPSAPLAEVCSLLPIAVCGTAATPYFGFQPGRVYLLKGRQSAKDGTNFGDYHLLRPAPEDDTNDGLRRNFAGGFGSCRLIRGGSPTPTIEIKPGSNVGPVAQGVNARFDEYIPAGQLSAAQFPPDVIIDEPSPLITVNGNDELKQGSRTIVWGTEVTGPNRADYLNRLATGPSAYDIPPLPAPGRGALLRREVAVPIADCTAPINQNALPLRGAGCFFLMQKMTSGSKESRLIGEFIPDCEAAGRPGTDPSGGGPYVIQLFRDSSSSDS